MDKPEVIAVIPDGNRRRARKNSVDFLSAYFEGSKKGWELAEWCLKYPSIRKIYIYAYSLQNLARGNFEQEIFKKFTKRELERTIAEIGFFNDRGIRISFIGELGIFGSDLVELFRTVEEKTKGNERLELVVCYGYSGRKDIIQAGKKGVIRDNLYGGFEEIDLLLRTGGEKRLSDFLPYQIKNTELFFSEKLWGEFNENDLDKVIQGFGSKSESDFE